MHRLMWPSLAALLLLACQATPDPVALAVAEDSAQFAAVVDTLTAYPRDRKLSITPLPLDADSALILGSDSVRNYLTRIITARSSVLRAKQVAMVHDLKAGDCPWAFSLEDTSFCPPENEQRFAITIAREYQDTTTLAKRKRMSFFVRELNPGGTAESGGDIVLEHVDGHWKILQRIWRWATP